MVTDPPDSISGAPDDSNSLSEPSNSTDYSSESGSSGFDALPGFAQGGGIPPGNGSATAAELPEDFNPDNIQWRPIIPGYTIKKWLSGGGYGCVYLAHNTVLDCLVAIKILNPRWIGTPEAVERFVREVTATARNRHRHIVQVMNTGRVSGSVWHNCPFMAMEYLSGGDFYQWLSNHPRTSRRDPNLRLAVQKIAEVCEGLHALHEAGMIHRDIKPANILLDQNDVPRLADFGLAEVHDIQRAALHNKQPGVTLPDGFDLQPPATLTAGNEIPGTSGYIAPELFAGAENASPASDQYAIGVILYQVLCSLRPFQNHEKDPDERQRIEVAAEVSASHKKARTPPPPSSKSSFRDAGLQYICLKCLRPEPELRYKSIESLRLDLLRWLNGELVQDNPLTRFWNESIYRPLKSRPLWYLGLTATVLTFIGLIYGLSASLVHQAELNASLGDRKNALKKATDAEERLRQQLVETLVAQGETTSSNGDLDLAMLAWSAAWQAELGSSKPDQQQISTLKRRLELADRLQPPLQLTVPGKHVIRDAEYSAAGDRLVLNEGGAITVIDPRTGQRLQDRLKMPVSSLKLAISPDASRVATWSTQFEGPPVLGLFDLRTGERHLVEIDFFVGDLAFTADGKQLAVCSAAMSQMEAGRLEIRDAFTLATAASVKFAERTSCLAIHPDGSRIAVMHLGAKCRVTIHAADTLQEVHSIAAAPNKEMCDLSYSPDGKQLAAASCDGVVMLADAEKTEAETAAPDKSALLQEATMDGVVDGWGRNLGFVRFSADGQRLATACGDRTVRIWDPTKRRECSPPLTHAAHVTALSFSPDRNYILTSSLDNLGRIWDVASAQSLPGNLRHQGAVLSAAFHPDGRTLYTASEDGETRIWRFRPQNPLQPDSDSAIVMQVLSPDASLLAVQDAEKNFRVFDARSLQPVCPLFACSHPAHLLSFSSDGSAMALTGATLDGKGMVSLFNTRTGELLGEEFSVANLPLHQSFSPDGRWLAVIAARRSGKSLWIYDRQQQVCHQISNVEPDCLAWHPASTADLFVGSRDSRILRISLPELAVRETGASGDTQVIRSLTFSPDGTLLATVTGEAVRIQQTASLNAPDPMVIRHQQEPNGAVFSKDNGKLLTWGNDGVVQVWNRAGEKQRWELHGQIRHKAAVNSATFNTDGSLFASASSDGTAAVWETRSCLAAGPRLIHTLAGIGVREVQQVRFGPDGRSVLTSTSNSEGLLKILPETLLYLNLPQNQRAGYSTLQPLLTRSCMNIWNWSPDRTFAGPDDAKTVAVHLSGSSIEENGRFVRLGPVQYRQFLQQIPDSYRHAATTRLQLARLLMLAEEYNLATAEYRKTIQLAPTDDGLLWFEYGKAIYENDAIGQFSEAIRALNKSEALGYTDAQLYLTRGRLLRNNARFEQALPDLQKAVQQSRMPVVIGMDLANCEAELGQFDAAADSFDAAMEAGRTFSVAIPPVKRYQRIVLDYARSKPEDAARRTREYLAESSSADDVFVCYHASLASVLTPAAFTDRDVILQMARKALKLRPDDREVSNCLAYVLIRSGRSEDLQEAEKLLQQTLAPTSGNGDAQSTLPASPLRHYFLSLLHRRQNRPQEAQQAFETAEKLRQAMLAQLDTPAVREEFPWSRRAVIELLAVETKP